MSGRGLATCLVLNCCFFFLSCLIILYRSSNFLDTIDGPIPVSGGGSSKGSSEAFPFEYSAPVRTTRIGLRLAKVYDITQGTGVVIHVGMVNCFTCL